VPDDGIVYLFQRFSAVCREEPTQGLSALIKEKIKQGTEVIVVNPKLPASDDVKFPNLFED